MAATGKAKHKQTLHTPTPSLNEWTMADLQSINRGSQTYYLDDLILRGYQTHIWPRKLKKILSHLEPELWGGANVPGPLQAHA